MTATKHRASKNGQAARNGALHVPPPHDPQAERSVLGSMMRDNAVIADVVNILRLEHFYVFAHQKIFEAITTLAVDKGRPADAVTLADYLREKQLVEECGGYAFLTELWDAAPSAANAAYYAMIVREHKLRRDVCHAAAQLQRGADLRQPVDELLQAAQQLAQLAQAARPTDPTICLESVEPRSVEWLWKGYIPLRGLTGIEGDGGRGKSLLTCDLTARVTRGWNMPPSGGDAGGDPGAVLLLSAEDDLERTIRPRLDAAGADVRRVRSLSDFNGRPVVLPDDLPRIERIITQHGITLVVVDPVAAYYAEGIDTHKDADIRRVLYPMAMTAMRTNSAWILIRHWAKGARGGDVMHAGGGSVAFAAACRSVLAVAPHPDDAARRVLASAKCNLCATPPALEYAIVDGQLGWIGETNITAAELTSRQTNKALASDDRDAATVRKACTRLLVALDGIDPHREGAADKPVREQARLSGRDMRCATTTLIAEGTLERVSVAVPCGKGTRKVDGLRRPHTGTPGLPVCSPDVPMSR
jgi:hypothetical protein